MKQWRRRNSSGTCVTDPNQSGTQQPRRGLQTNSAGLIRVHSQSALWSPRAAWSSEYHRWGSGHLRSPQAAFSTRLRSNKPEMLSAELQLWSLELLSNRLMKVGGCRGGQRVCGFHKCHQLLDWIIFLLSDVLKLQIGLLTYLQPFTCQVRFWFRNFLNKCTCSGMYKITTSTVQIGFLLLLALPFLCKRE